LIELLVVIVVVVLLAAICLPVFKSVREHSEYATCQANLHQIGAATQLYISDNGGRMLRQCGYEDPNHFWWAWFDYLEPYLGKKSGHRRAVYCLTADRILPDDLVQFTGYSFNGNLDERLVSTFEDSSLIPLAWDDVQKNDAGYTNYCGGWPTATWSGGGSWYKFAYRHGGKCNILFLDGHVGSILEGRHGTAEDYPQYDWQPK
jgi:general secretion pathway protein G